MAEEQPPQGNRQLRRMQAKEERSQEKQKATTTARARAQQRAGSERVGARQFTREVVGEMKKVLWPSRQQVINSFFIVLVTVVFMTALIWLLDIAFTYLRDVVYAPGK